MTLRENTMKSMKRFIALALLGSAALGINCTKQKSEWKGTMNVEDGVTIVKNPKEPIYDGPILELTEDLAIKGSGEDEERMFQSIHTLDVDEDGTMYILDEQAGNIKVHDHTGSFVKTIGRKGQGPGEFGLPISLILTPEHNVVVNDLGQRKLLFFEKDGKYLKQISLADKFLFLGPLVTNDGHMIAMHTVPSDKPETFLRKFSSELEPVLSFTSAYLERPPAADIFVALHLSRLMWNLAPNGHVIWADIKNPDYLIYEHNLDGKLIRKTTKEFDPISVTAEDKEKLMDRAFGDNPTRDQWDVRFPDTFPPFKGFSFDDEGRLFVRRYQRDENNEGELFDIFDVERRYLACQRIEMNPMIWKQSYMYTIDDDTEGFKVVKRYKVKWKI
jgi:hypothetical protein